MAAGGSSFPIHEDFFPGPGSRTKYLYGCPSDASLQTAVVYPDSNDVVTADVNGDWVIASGTDHTSAIYDWLGRAEFATDQRGVTHQYGYNAAGQPYIDFVLNYPGTVNGTVRAIATFYDSLGRVSTVQSWGYDSDHYYGPLNEVDDFYDGWGNLSQQRQGDNGSHPCAVISYSYDDAAVGDVAQYLRLQSMTYRSPLSATREIDYNYSNPDAPSQSAIDEALSRLGSIGDLVSGVPETLASESYLGLSDIVTENYDTPGISLDYTQGGAYAGLDRFGRVVDQVWSQAGQINPLDEYQYAYDAVGNENLADQHDRPGAAQPRPVGPDAGLLQHQPPVVQLPGPELPKRLRLRLVR